MTTAGNRLAPTWCTCWRRREKGCSPPSRWRAAGRPSTSAIAALVSCTSASMLWLGGSCPSPWLASCPGARRASGTQYTGVSVRRMARSMLMTICPALPCGGAPSGSSATTSQTGWLLAGAGSVCSLASRRSSNTGARSAKRTRGKSSGMACAAGARGAAEGAAAVRAGRGAVAGSAGAGDGASAPEGVARG
ncbi:hypothetical protein D3C72_1226680 [compost metagenome]